MRTGPILRVILIVGLAVGHYVNGQDEVLKPDVPLVDTLNQSNLQDAFRMLRRRYVAEDEVSFLEINRAALSGLLERLGRGAQLVPEKAPDEEEPFRLVSELVDSETAYIRPVRLNGAELKAFDTALRGFARSSAKALVLDLRCPADRDQGSLMDSAAFAGRFLPKGTSLFSVARSGESELSSPISTQKNPTWKKDLVLLVDEDTGSAGEVLAACLRRHLGCLIVGGKTSGLSADYEAVPIGPNAHLRFAVAVAIFADGSKLFGHGLEPDLPCYFEFGVKAKIFRASQAESVGKFVFESERSRLNEAALIARTNPELPYRVRKSSGEAPGDESPVYDRVLQSAIDALVAKSIFDSKNEEESGDAGG